LSGPVRAEGKSQEAPAPSTGAADDRSGKGKKKRRWQMRNTDRTATVVIVGAAGYATPGMGLPWRQPLDQA
jgi:hypothetical protein